MKDSNDCPEIAATIAPAIEKHALLYEYPAPGGNRRRAPRSTVRSSHSRWTKRWSPSNPAWWLNARSTVIASKSRPVAGPSSGRYRETGSSSSRRPSWTSTITAAEVNVLLIEPTWNSDAGVTGAGWSTLVTPWAAVWHSSPTSTPTAAPGTRCRSTDARSAASSSPPIAIGGR